METKDFTLHRDGVDGDFDVTLYGTAGRPVIVFPEGDSSCSSWEDGGMIDALSDADIDLLNRLFAGLGLSGRDSQEVLLAGCVRAISEARQEAAAMAREVDRLYVSLGLLIGLMLALIVI